MFLIFTPENIKRVLSLAVGVQKLAGSENHKFPVFCVIVESIIVRTAAPGYGVDLFFTSPHEAETHGRLRWYGVWMDSSAHSGWSRYH